MEPTRYPFELIETLRLKDGRSVLMRPIHPQDEPIVQSFVRALSPRSRYLRFHTAIRELDPRMLHAATHVDYQRHLALIVESFDGDIETEVGAARYVARREDPRTADFAVAIADAWQRQGLARRLLERLMQLAASRGVRRFSGDVLEDNHPMVNLAGELGFDIEPSTEPGVLVVVRSIAPGAELPLRPLMPGIEEAFAYPA